MKIQLTNKKDTKMKMKCTLAALSVAVLTVAGTGISAYGQDADDGWRFSAGIPLWAPAVDGNVTLGGRQENVNLSFDQIKKNLDTAFGLSLQARCDLYGFYAAPAYMKFSGDAGPVFAQLKLFVGDVGGFYRFLNTGGDHPFILEGLAGVRIWATDTTFSSPIPILNGGKNRNLADPIIGLRGSQVLFRKCHLDFAGDVGGFDINNRTDLTWSASGVVTYDIKRWFSVSAGYRALSIDEEKGGGTSQNGLDIIMHGPTIVAKFTF
jgi:hypothetical protein